MRTIELKVFTFDELSEEAKKRALQTNRDVLVESDWWESDFYDAKETADMDIKEFDIFRGSITSKIITSCKQSAQKVLENHGDSCATYSIAKKFLSDLDSLESQPDTAKTEVLIEDLEDRYKTDMEKQYLRMLDTSYDYLLSDAAIIEFLVDNEYEFLEDGRSYK